MREIKQDVYLNEPFLMVDSGDYGTGITSLTFSNSGDIQLMKPGGGFMYIDSACYITERGFGWYTLQSSVTSHMDTLGRSVLHIEETSSLSAWPADMEIDVVANRAADTHTSVGSLDTRVTSLDVMVGSMDTNTSSYDQYKADLTALTSDVAAGTVIFAISTQRGTSPMIVWRKTNWNGYWFLDTTFSSYITSGYPVYITAYNKERNGTEIFTVVGTTDISSLTATFSLDPNSHTDYEPGEHYRYEVQFRQESATVIANAVVGTLRIEPTLKL